MKTIRLAIFNEPYWDKGLIYTQNILPLKKMVELSQDKLEVISFTSLPVLILEWKKIKIAKKEFAKQGIKVKDYPILFYPTRFMALFYFLLPWYFMNIFLYIKYLSYVDKYKTIIYNMRSYQVSLGFLMFYKNKNNLVFDLRTDYIEENINRGLFKAEGITTNYWRRVEKEMLCVFRKSLFISQQFRTTVLQRNCLIEDEEKYPIVYNPIDYSHFQSIKRDEISENFLYTGSLGHWNNITNYLDFFLVISTYFPKSNLIICTASPVYKVEPILKECKYDSIRSRVVVKYNVPYHKLPKYYAKCKYGLQIMDKPDTRVGVKFIEYVAAGILPIVHENVKGAAHLVERFGLGLVFNNHDLIKPSLLADKIYSTAGLDMNSDNYINFREHTDLNLIANKLLKIYDYKEDMCYIGKLPELPVEH